jgi:hypothetical protein
VTGPFVQPASTTVTATVTAARKAEAVRRCLPTFTPATFLSRRRSILSFF